MDVIFADHASCMSGILAMLFTATLSSLCGGPVKPVKQDQSALGKHDAARQPITFTWAYVNAHRYIYICII